MLSDRTSGRITVWLTTMAVLIAFLVVALVTLPSTRTADEPTWWLPGVVIRTLPQQRTMMFYRCAKLVGMGESGVLVRRVISKGWTLDLYQVRCNKT